MAEEFGFFLPAAARNIFFLRDAQADSGAKRAELAAVHTSMQRRT